MSTITTRAAKGSPLSFNELDANLNNLNTDKYQSGDSPSFNVITSTGGQIVFPATQNPSAGANTLDDYKESTWTPVVTPASGSLTAYSAAGRYTKIGNCYLFTMIVNITTVGTAGGSATITHPFGTILQNCSIAGSESAITGVAFSAFVRSGVITVLSQTGGTPFTGSGQVWEFSGLVFV